MVGWLVPPPPAAAAAAPPQPLSLLRGVPALSPSSEREEGGLFLGQGGRP